MPPELRRADYIVSANLMRTLKEGGADVVLCASNPLSTQDDVAAARVAGDEGVGEGRREAREVRAHRVERVAPEPLLVLPLRCDPDRWQRGR